MLSAVAYGFAYTRRGSYPSGRISTSRPSAASDSKNLNDHFVALEEREARLQPRGSSAALVGVTTKACFQHGAVGDRGKLSKILGGQDRLELHTRGLERFGGAFEAVDDRDDAIDNGTRSPDRLDRLQC